MIAQGQRGARQLGAVLWRAFAAAAAEPAQAVPNVGSKGAVEALRQRLAQGECLLAGRRRRGAGLGARLLQCCR